MDLKEVKKFIVEVLAYESIGLFVEERKLLIERSREVRDGIES